MGDLYAHNLNASTVSSPLLPNQRRPRVGRKWFVIFAAIAILGAIAAVLLTANCKQNLSVPTLEASAPTIASRPSSLVYIIQHGEKQSLIGCLNEEGKLRADNLPNVFSSQNRFSTYVTPHSIFANFYGDQIDCERCIETATPISKHLLVPINHTYGGNIWLGGNGKAAAAITKNIIRHHSVNGKQMGAALVIWDHDNIKYLARDLGVREQDVPLWPDSDFDSVWELSYSVNIDATSATLQSFTVGAQHPGGTKHATENSAQKQVFEPGKDSYFTLSGLEKLIELVKLKIGGEGNLVED